MTRTFAVTCLVALAAACGAPEEESDAAGWGAETQADDDVASLESELASSFDFVIKQGKHDSNPGGPRSVKLNTHVGRKVTFDVMFPVGSETGRPALPSWEGMSWRLVLFFGVCSAVRVSSCSWPSVSLCVTVLLRAIVRCGRACGPGARGADVEFENV